MFEGIILGIALTICYLFIGYIFTIVTDENDRNKALYCMICWPVILIVFVIFSLLFIVFGGFKKDE